MNTDAPKMRGEMVMQRMPLRANSRVLGRVKPMRLMMMTFGTMGVVEAFPGRQLRV